MSVPRLVAQRCASRPPGRGGTGRATSRRRRLGLLRLVEGGEDVGEVLGVGGDERFGVGHGGEELEEGVEGGAVGRGQVGGEDPAWLELADAGERLAVLLAVDEVGPGGIGEGPAQHPPGEGFGRHVGRRLGRLGEDRPEGVHREHGAGRFVEQPGGQGAVVERRLDGAEGAIPDVDLVTLPDRVDAVEGHVPPRGHAQGAEGVADEAGVGGQLEHPLDAARVVGVVVGEPHPAQGGRVDDRRQRVDEVRSIEADARVDEHRLLGEEDEGVHREHSHSRQGEVSGQDVDVGADLVGGIHRAAPPGGIV